MDKISYTLDEANLKDIRAALVVCLNSLSPRIGLYITMLHITLPCVALEATATNTINADTT